MRKRKIAIFSSSEDYNSTVVEEELRRRDLSFQRFDRPDFSRDRLVAEIGMDHPWEISMFQGLGQELRMEELRSVWYRRPSKYSFLDNMSPKHLAFAEGEATK